MAEPVGAELCCASCRTMRAFLHARVRVAVWRARARVHSVSAGDLGRSLANGEARPDRPPELPRAALATSAVMVLLTPRKAAGKA